MEAAFFMVYCISVWIQAETTIETQASSLRLMRSASPAIPLPSSRKLEGSGIEGGVGGVPAEVPSI